MTADNATTVDKAVAETTGSIVLESVNYNYDSGTPWVHSGLRDVSLTIDQGERVLVVGHNGSGKSTLAWILSGLYPPTSGIAIRNGVALEEQVEKLGFLLQHTRLQLLSPTIGAEFSAVGVSSRVGTLALARMGLEHLGLGRRLEELSVGQQRRVGLAILFARRCDVVVLDEPLAGLDSIGCERIVAAVNGLPDHTIVVTVTHDLDASAKLGDRVIKLEDGRVDKEWAL